MAKLTLLITALVLFPTLGHAGRIDTNGDNPVLDCSQYNQVQAADGIHYELPVGCSHIVQKNDRAVRKILNENSDGKFGPVPDQRFENDHGSGGCQEDDCDERE